MTKEITISLKYKSGSEIPPISFDQIVKSITNLLPHMDVSLIKRSDTLVVCPRVRELTKEVETLQSKYSKTLDYLDDLKISIREKQNIPASVNRNIIEKDVRDIVDDILEEKERMGD